MVEEVCKVGKKWIIVRNDVSTIYLWKTNFVCRANRLLLVKYDNKKVKSPHNWVMSPLT